MKTTERELYRLATAALDTANSAMLEDLARAVRDTYAAKYARRPATPLPGEEFKTCLEYWADGEEPPKTVTKRPPLKELGEYTTVRVTFADGSSVRAGTYERDKQGNPDLAPAVRWARSLRIREECERLEAERAALYGPTLERFKVETDPRARKNLARTLARLRRPATPWTWTQTPTNWRRVRSATIPPLERVEIIDPDTGEALETYQREAA